MSHNRYIPPKKRAPLPTAEQAAAKLKKKLEESKSSALAHTAAKEKLQKQAERETALVKEKYDRKVAELRAKHGDKQWDKYMWEPAARENSNEELPELNIYKKLRDAEQDKIDKTKDKKNTKDTKDTKDTQPEEISEAEIIKTYHTAASENGTVNVKEYTKKNKKTLLGSAFNTTELLKDFDVLYGAAIKEAANTEILPQLFTQIDDLCRNNLLELEGRPARFNREIAEKLLAIVDHIVRYNKTRDQLTTQGTSGGFKYDEKAPTKKITSETAAAYVEEGEFNPESNIEYANEFLDLAKAFSMNATNFHGIYRTCVEYVNDPDNLANQIPGLKSVVETIALTENKDIVFVESVIARLEQLHKDVLHATSTSSGPNLTIADIDLLIKKLQKNVSLQKSAPSFFDTAVDTKSDLQSRGSAATASTTKSFHGAAGPGGHDKKG